MCSVQMHERDEHSCNLYVGGAPDGGAQDSLAMLGHQQAPANMTPCHVLAAISHTSISTCSLFELLLAVTVWSQ